MIVDKKLKIIQLTSVLVKHLQNAQESLYLTVEKDGKKIQLGQE